MKIDKLIKFSRQMETGKFGFNLESSFATGHVVKFSSETMKLRLVNGINIRYLISLVDSNILIPLCSLVEHERIVEMVMQAGDDVYLGCEHFRSSCGDLEVILEENETSVLYN